MFIISKSRYSLVNYSCTVDAAKVSLFCVYNNKINPFKSQLNFVYGAWFLNSHALQSHLKKILFLQLQLKLLNIITDYFADMTKRSTGNNVRKPFPKTKIIKRR